MRLVLVLFRALWAATNIVAETTCTLVDAMTTANTDTDVGAVQWGHTSPVQATNLRNRKTELRGEIMKTQRILLISSLGAALLTGAPASLAIEQPAILFGGVSTRPVEGSWRMPCVAVADAFSASA